MANPRQSFSTSLTTSRWSKVELLRDVRMAVEQIGTGNGVSNREAKAELRRRFNR